MQGNEGGRGTLSVVKVLVTGSSGHLGKEICRQLVPKHEVRGLDLVPGPFTQHLGSVADASRVSELVRGMDVIVHTASLHAPHVPSRPKQDFVDVNIKGTLHLLEAAVRERIARFVYTSTTSVYGFAMEPLDRAVWVTEELQPRPRDIYDVSKLAAEDLCRLFARENALAVTCLRTSRFYRQEPWVIAWYRLYRGADVRDIARAHVLAAHNAQTGFELFNVSGPTPFLREDAEELYRDAPKVVRRRAPALAQEFERRGWALPQSVDRVYVSARAAEHLGYQPQFGWDKEFDVEPDPSGDED